MKILNLVKKISLDNVKKEYLVFQTIGYKGCVADINNEYQLDDKKYSIWYEQNKITKSIVDAQKEQMFDYEPLLSILVPVYNTPEDLLKDMVMSVCEQTYAKWELCIANANPANEKVSRILNDFMKSDPRIKMVEVPDNSGIAQNTNAALHISEGEYICLLDHDDMLAPNALYEIICKLNGQEPPELIYTDEDKVTIDGKIHFQPHFKPDFNLDLIRSNNYICHFLVVKKSLAEDVGGFREEFNGAQDYDFILRCIEKTRKISHIPKVLYHWRMHRESTADNPLSKMYAYSAGKKAIEEHLQRCGETGEVLFTENFGFYRIRYKLLEKHFISIIILCRDDWHFLINCIESMQFLLNYSHYEIIVVECGKNRIDTSRYYKKVREYNIKILHWKKEYNYASIINWGVENAKGEYICLLSPYLKVINAESVLEMMVNILRQDIGVVGGKIYYPNNTIRHAGLVLHQEGIIERMFFGLSKNNVGYMHRESLQQNLSAVTSECMMIKRKVFEMTGGFVTRSKEIYSDIDFCLKVKKIGCLVTYNPYASFVYGNKKKRDVDKRERGRMYIKTKVGKKIFENDLMYNPNLSFGFSVKLKNE